MPQVGVALGAAWTGAAFGGGLAGALTSFALKTAVSFGISKLIASTMKPTQTGGLLTGYTLSGEEHAQSVIFGRYATGGCAVCPPYSFDFDDDMDGEYLVYVISLADHPIEALDSIIIDGQPCSIAPTQKVLGESGWIPEDNYGKRITDENGRLDKHAWVRFFDGTQTTADQKMVSMFYGHPTRPWDHTMTLRQVPYAVVTFKYKMEKFTGLPECRFVVRGSKLYDPRTEEWSYTDNPVVMIWNLIRGLPIKQAAGMIYGLNVPETSLPLDAWTAAMNACDEDADGEPRYRCGLEFSLEEEPLGVIDEILKSFGGQIAESGGVYNISVGAPAFPSASITDDDIIISNDREFVATDGMSKSYNTVSASYPDPAQIWEERQAITYTNAASRSADGGQRLVVDLRLPGVPYPKQVRRLMRELEADNRRDKRHTITVGPWAMSLMPLQTVSWTSAEHGYAAKLFEITSLIIDPASLNITLSLRERDPSDYNADPESDGVVPSDPSPFEPIQNSTVQGFAVAGIVLTDAEGKPRQAAIEMTWAEGAPYSAISYEVRLLGATQLSLSGSIVDVAGARAVVSAGVLPATQYQVRAKPVVAGKEPTWTDWLPLTTPEASGPGAEVGDGDITTDKLADDSITAPKIKKGELFHSKSYAIADLTLAKTRDFASTIFEETIADFEGGGFLVNFEGVADSVGTTSGYVALRLRVNGVIVNDLWVGSNVNGSRLPVSLSATAKGIATIKVDGWSNQNSSYTGSPAGGNVVLKYIKISVAGVKR